MLISGENAEGWKGGRADLYPPDSLVLVIMKLNNLFEIMYVIICSIGRLEVIDESCCYAAIFYAIYRILAADEPCR